MQVCDRYAAVGQKIQIGANRVYELRDLHCNANDIPLVQNIERHAGKYALTAIPLRARPFGMPA
ncbi:protein of unknown function [Burkholderia multivorans]